MWTYEKTYDELYHHGILGQKWGVRRYQNEDGSLTDAGKKRYDSYSDKAYKKSIKMATNQIKIDELTNKYNHSKKRQQLEMKKQRLQSKHDRLEPKRRKIQDKMLMYGKRPGIIGRSQLKKAAKVDRKLAKVDRKLIRGDMKVSKLEYQITKYQHQIDKMFAKATNQKLSSLSMDDIRRGSASLISSGIDRNIITATVSKIGPYGYEPTGNEIVVTKKKG